MIVRLNSGRVALLSAVAVAELCCLAVASTKTCNKQLYYQFESLICLRVATHEVRS